MRKKIINGFISIFTAQIGFLLIGVALTPFLVRILGSDGYGDYAFVLSIILISMVFANAGIFDGVRKYISEDRPVEDWQDAVFGYYARVSIIFGFTISFIIIVITYSGLANLFIESRFNTYLYLTAAVIVARQFYYTLRGVLMGIGLEQYGEPLRVVKQILFAIFGLSLAYVGYGVAGVLLGNIISHILIGVVSLIILARRLNLTAAFRPAPDSLPTKELLSFNGLTVIFTILLFSLYHLDILMLQPLTGSEQTGYYKAALVTAEFLWLAPTALQLILLQSSSELSSRGELDDVSDLATQTFRYTLLLTLLLALGLVALAEPFIRLYYGAAFAAAVGPFLLLLPGAIGFALARPIYSIAQGMGKLRVLITATGGSAILNIVLNLILIPSYGMYGAAIATSISYGSMFIFHVAAARYIGYKPLVGARLPQVAVTAIVSAPLIIGAAYIINSPIYSLFIIPPLGCLIYIIISLQTGAVSQNELHRIVDSLPTPYNSIMSNILNIIS